MAINNEIVHRFFIFFFCYVWADTSLAHTRFIYFNGQIVYIYIYDQLMAYNSYKIYLEPIHYICKIQDSWNLPHYGHHTLPMQRFIYLVIEYDLTLQAYRVPDKKMQILLKLLKSFIFFKPLFEM